MKTQIYPEVFASAIVVAENLKRQLEARLINKTAGTATLELDQSVEVFVPA